MKKNTIMIMAAAFAASLALTGCAPQRPATLPAVEITPPLFLADGTYNPKHFDHYTARACDSFAYALWKEHATRHLPTDFMYTTGADEYKALFIKVMVNQCLAAVYDKTTGKPSDYQARKAKVLAEAESKKVKGKLSPEAFLSTAQDVLSITAYGYGWTQAKSPTAK
ncbi:TPA: hypothetical protein ACITN2_004336 [Salmonella enterica subsp. enterica serovar Virchow]